jgi:hypothetical protein
MIIDFRIFESKNIETIKNEIRHHSIRYENREDMINICKILVYLGFSVYNSDKIIGGDFDFRRFENDQTDHHGIHYDFMRSGSIRSAPKENELNYLELKKIVGDETLSKINSIKRIENELDPYGEDDWGYTNEKEYWEIPDKTLEEIKETLLNYKIMFYDNIEMIEECKELVNLGFKVMGSDDILNGTQDFPEFRYNCFVNVQGKFLKVYGIDYDFCVSIHEPDDDSIDYSGFLDLLAPLRIKNPAIDPYGEEDWGYKIEEEFIIPNIIDDENIKQYLKTCSISFETEEQMMNIFNELEKMGFRVYQSGEIKHWQEMDNYKSFLGGTYSDCDFLRSIASEPIYAKNNLNYYQFFNIIGKGKEKYKRLENPDIDPYSEEDWGYLTTNESRKRSFKPIDYLISDFSKSFIGLKRGDYAVDLKTSKIVNKLKKEIADHYVHFEDANGEIYNTKIDEIYIRNLPDKDGKISDSSLCVILPPQFPRHWTTQRCLRLPQTIIIYEPSPPKRVYSKMDPYGEEDWDLE